MPDLLPTLVFIAALQQRGPGVGAISFNIPGEIFVIRRDSGDNGDGGDDPSNGDSGNGNGNGNGNGKSSTTTSSDKKHDSTTTTFTSTSSAATPTSSSSSLSTKSSSNDSSLSSNTNSLSPGTRAGIAFGILFGAIALALLFCYCRRRARKAKERAANETASPLSSEVQRYVPPVSASAVPPPSSQQDIPPLSHLRTNEELPIAPDGVPDSPVAAVSGAALLSRDPPRRGPSPTSAWRRNSTLSPTDTQASIMASDVHLPNPYDPFATPARAASLGSTSAASPSATTSAYGVSAAASSASTIPERRASALHMDLLLYQKQLESEHNKESLEPRVEPLDPPPSYTS